jgi:hypothetical protein
MPGGLGLNTGRTNQTPRHEHVGGPPSLRLGSVMGVTSHAQRATTCLAVERTTTSPDVIRRNVTFYEVLRRGWML